MPAIVFPDNSVRQFDESVSGITVASSISANLAKTAVAMYVDDELSDITRIIDHDAKVRFITPHDPESLDLIRHDAAHVLAEAVQALYPGTQATIGPVIQDGFYYDFARDKPFTPEDLPVIEAKMREIIAANAPIEREVWQRDKAIEFFAKRGEFFKVELIRDLPEDQVVTIYRQGEWLDLCRGPHMRQVGEIGQAFKLTKVAGAYWRGDHRNPMLTRIYGTAWRNQKELDSYLKQIEEAGQRDHRRIGKDMDLFHLQEEAVGSVFWHPNGWRIYRVLEDYIRRVHDRHDYVEVRTPQVIDRSLWEASGHWDKFRQNMFITHAEDEDKIYALKPMNCPCHVQIFRKSLKSYRDLPLRMAEFGSLHRYEPSGSLHGVMRVRAFVQDDAHIFCTSAQLKSEVGGFINMLTEIYTDLGFREYRVKFSDRPKVRVGDDTVWDYAEATLREACHDMGLSYELNPGEGAFYGPKLEFVLRDAMGRDWQCGTLQVDYIMPERLDASYVGEDSGRHRPVMLHCAVIGTFERFLGILIEQCAGHFPLWLAPIQVVVASIVTDVTDYAFELYKCLQKAGIMAEADLRNEKINAKIREHSSKHVPVILVVGRREAENKTVSVRRLGKEKQDILPFDEFIASFKEEVLPPDLKRAKEL